MGSILSDLAGTILDTFQVGLSGPILKRVSSALLVRNSGDTADAAITASAMTVSGKALIFGSTKMTIDVTAPDSGQVLSDIWLDPSTGRLFRWNGSVWFPTWAEPGQLGFFGFAATVPYWLNLNTQPISVSRTAYPELFARIGTTWGAADGSSFNLPPVAGRAIVGAGTGSGLTARAVGDTFGVETVSLTEAQIARHTHTVPSRIGTLASSSNTAAATGTASSSVPTTSESGNGDAHTNIQPSVAVGTHIFAGR